MINLDANLLDERKRKKRRTLLASKDDGDDKGLSKWFKPARMLG
jgi:hypothetical protein